MKSYFSRFSHHITSHLGGKPDTASALSYSDLIGVSRSNQVANLSNLDHRVKPDGDIEEVDHRVKFENDSLCAGRSMVEMLGVLAIIGVLSVGAIAGYSKAMMKYKLNKMVDQYNQLFGTIAIHREEFIKLSTPTQFVSLYPIIYKMGELPDGMKLSDNIFAYDILKHSSELRSFRKTAIMFYLQLSNSDEQHSSSPDLIDACRNMYQYLLIPRQDDVVYAFFYHNDEQGAGNEGIVYGNKACAPDLKCLKDLTIGDIDAICNSAQKNRETRLVVKF